MKSIERYLESISSYDEEKRPFIEQIEGIDAKIDSIESEIEELEAEISDLNDEKEASEKELEKVEKKRIAAYLESLSDPKAAINRVSECIKDGALNCLKLDYKQSNPLVIVTAKFKFVSVTFSFPDSALSLEQYGLLYINVEPKQKTIPGQMKKTIKLLKQCGVLNGLKRTIGDSYLLLATLDNQPEIVIQRLSRLNNVAAELDSSMNSD